MAKSRYTTLPASPIHNAKNTNLERNQKQHFQNRSWKEIPSETSRPHYFHFVYSVNSNNIKVDLSNHHINSQLALSYHYCLFCCSIEASNWLRLPCTRYVKSSGYHFSGQWAGSLMRCGYLTLGIHLTYCSCVAAVTQPSILQFR